MCRPDHLYRVQEDLGAPGPTRSELMASHSLQESGLVFAHQRPGGELAEALSSGYRPDAPVVLEERAQLGQPEEVYRGLWQVTVGHSVAERPQPSESSSVSDEGLVMRKAGPGRPWGRRGRGPLKRPEERVPVHPWAASRTAFPRREEVIGPAHKLFLKRSPSRRGGGRQPARLQEGGRVPPFSFVQSSLHLVC